MKSNRSDNGIGLTEIAVAIVIMGIILIAIFPVLVNSLNQARLNTYVSQANAAVSAAIDNLIPASIGGNCVNGSWVGGARQINLPDSRLTNVSLRAEYRCVGNIDNLVTVDVKAWKSGDSTQKIISSATTQLVIS